MNKDTLEYIETRANEDETGSIKAVSCADVRAMLDERAELLKALEMLQDSFIHAEGNPKGNKAKTDIITLNPDVRDALNHARQIRWKVMK